MGSESLTSPGYRRNSGPLSPSPFKRSLSSPDASWRSLAHRHKFLLYTLGLLTLLCTVYLYFAITWGASDSCSGLGGSERALCLKAESLKSHHRRLLYVEESDTPGMKFSPGGRWKEFEAFFKSVINDDRNVVENMRLRGYIDDLRSFIRALLRTIRALQRENSCLRKTVTVLRKDHHTLPEGNHAPLTAIPVPPKAPRLRGDI